jgi:hypothetical protein
MNHDKNKAFRFHHALNVSLARFFTTQHTHSGNQSQGPDTENMGCSAWMKAEQRAHA